MKENICKGNKLLVIIAIVTVIGFSITSCSNPMNDKNDNHLNNINDNHSIPTPITVTGIPPEYRGDNSYISLHVRLEVTMVASSSASIIGSSAIFTDELSIIPGVYDIFLSIWNGNESRLYHAPSKSIIAGANEISFSVFSFVPPITVTVTGIPQQYHGWGGIGLGAPGSGGVGNRTGANIGYEITVHFGHQFPGVFDVALLIGNLWQTVYLIYSKTIVGGINTIPFTDFF